MVNGDGQRSQRRGGHTSWQGAVVSCHGWSNYLWKISASAGFSISLGAPCPELTLDVRMDCKPLLSADDDTRLFANTFNMPHDLDINKGKGRGF